MSNFISHIPLRQFKNFPASKKSLPKVLLTELENVQKRFNASEVLYGIQPILGALKTNQRVFMKLYLKDTFLKMCKRDLLDKNIWLAEILRLASIKSLQIMGVPSEFLNTLTNGRLNQGVAMECSPIPMPGLHENSIPSLLHFTHCSFARQSLKCCGSSSIILLLDRIQDVMNLGSILRSSVFFGVPVVLLPALSSALPCPLISKLSSGAMEALRFYRLGDPYQTLRLLSKSGFLIAGTAGRERNDFDELSIRHPLDLASVKPEHVGARACGLPQPLILAMGSEASGLFPEFLRLCNVVIRIPGLVDETHTFDDTHLTHLPSSLNVAAATAILLHSIVTLRSSTLCHKP